jgi:hypothetical protein
LAEVPLRVRPAWNEISFFGTNDSKKYLKQITLKCGDRPAQETRRTARAISACANRLAANASMTSIVSIFMSDRFSHSATVVAF